MSEKEKIVEWKNAVIKFRQLFDERVEKERYENRLVQDGEIELTHDNGTDLMQSSAVENVPTGTLNKNDKSITRNNPEYEASTSGSSSLVTDPDLRQLKTKIFEKDFVDLNHTYPIQKTKGFTETSLKNQPEELQRFFNEYKMSEKAKDSEHYFENEFGHQFFARNSRYANFAETLKPEDKQSLEDHENFSLTNSFRARLFNSIKDRLMTEKNNEIASQVFEQYLRKKSRDQAVLIFKNSLEDFLKKNKTKCPRYSHVIRKLRALIESGGMSVQKTLTELPHIEASDQFQAKENLYNEWIFSKNKKFEPENRELFENIVTQNWRDKKFYSLTNTKVMDFSLREILSQMNLFATTTVNI